MKTISMHTMSFVITLAVLAGLAGAPALAQGYTSTAELRQACESSPTKTVQITASVVIDAGPVYPAVERISTGCTLMFVGDGAGITFSKVSLRFAGPLRFSGNRKADVFLSEANLEATSVAFDLYGRGSKVIFDRPRVVASAGNFRLGFFEDSLFEVSGPFAAAPSQPVVRATGSFSLFTDTSAFLFKGARVQAGSLVSINLADEVAKLTMEETHLRSIAGAIRIFGQTRDIVVEINKGTFTAPDGITLAVDGRSSALIAKDLTLNGGTGNILLRGGSFSTKVELDNVTARTAATVSVEAGSFSSSALVEDSRLVGTAGVSIRADSQWSTTVVKNTTAAADTSVTITAGSNSTCDASGNILQAPIVRECF